MRLRGTFPSLFGAALGLTAIPSSAQSPGEGVNEDIILGAWSDPATCNIENAVQVSVDEILERGSALNGKCITVEGFWTARALFSHARDGNKPRSNVDKALRHRRIGIYAREELLEAAPRRSARYTMVGVLGQCETEWPSAMMVMGYCHYTGGPLLKVSQAIASQERKGR